MKDDEWFRYRRVCLKFVIVGIEVVSQSGLEHLTFTSDFKTRPRTEEVTCECSRGKLKGKLVLL